MSFSLAEKSAALGVVPRGFFSAAGFPPVFAVAKQQEPSNPFYVLLVLLGVVFFVTACAYGVMAFKAARPAAGSHEAPHALLQFLDRHGVILLIAEVGLLAVACFGAMATDRYWVRRAERQKTRDTSKTPRFPTGP